LTDIPLPPQGSTAWYAWADEQENISDQVANKEDKVNRSGATTGQVPALQADGTLAFTTVAGGTTDPEVVRDTIAAALVAGANVTITPNDAADTITIAATTDPEVVRDTIGTALVAGSNVTITPNDAGDTITIAATASSSSSGNERTMQGLYGVKAWTMDPLLATAVTSAALTSGTVYVGRAITVPGDVLTNIEFSITTAPSGLTLAKGAVYLPDGTQVAVTANQSANWTAVGRATAAFTSPYTVASGVTSVYLALIFVGTTPPVVSRAASPTTAAILAMSMSSGVRSGTRAGLTDMPSPLGTVTSSNVTLLTTAT